MVLGLSRLVIIFGTIPVSLKDKKFWKKETKIIISFLLLKFILNLKCFTDFGNKAWSLFLSLFWPLFNAIIIFEQAGAVAKIGSSLKPNWTILLVSIIYFCSLCFGNIFWTACFQAKWALSPSPSLSSERKKQAEIA